MFSFYVCPYVRVFLSICPCLSVHLSVSVILGTERFTSSDRLLRIDRKCHQWTTFLSRIYKFRSTLLQPLFCSISQHRFIVIFIFNSYFNRWRHKRHLTKNGRSRPPTTYPTTRGCCSNVMLCKIYLTLKFQFTLSLVGTR